ncbi:flavodoxin [Azohydromonas australica]|uniref:flavodoxin n=1 Tax=Azohydromonas australica TaxID=364039 RepID=UPI0003F63FFA|nr:flavodoxin [Azohydromonas australica]
MSEILVSRRNSLRKALLLAMSGSAGIAPGSGATQPGAGKSRFLVAYFSRTGNTRVIAGQIARAMQGDLTEIEPAQPYPEDYLQTVDQAKRESDAGYEPSLKAMVLDIQSYEAVFLGFPIWGMTAPPVIRSFLSRHDLAGKTLVPFITHGGYGTGQSLSVVAQKAPRARIMDAFVIKADQERDTLERVTRWLEHRPTSR